MDFFAHFVHTGKGFFIRESLHINIDKVYILDLPDLRAWCLERFGHDSQPVKTVDRAFRKLVKKVEGKEVKVLVDLYLDLTVRQKWPVRGQEFWHPLTHHVWQRILEIGLEPDEWIDLYDRMLCARDRYRRRKPRGTYDYTAFKYVVRRLVTYLDRDERRVWRGLSPKRLHGYFN